MLGFCVILTLAVLYITFMGGVIGYLIGRVSSSMFSFLIMF